MSNYGDEDDRDIGEDIRWAYIFPDQGEEGEEVEEKADEEETREEEVDKEGDECQPMSDDCNRVDEEPHDLEWGYIFPT